MKQSPITWQQIPSSVTFLIGTLVVLAAIFGTTAVNQYRQSQYEKNQDEIRQEIRDIRSSDIRTMQKDITDIKLFIGMGKQAFRPASIPSPKPTLAPLVPVNHDVQIRQSVPPTQTPAQSPNPQPAPQITGQILEGITDIAKRILP